MERRDLNYGEDGRNEKCIFLRETGTLGAGEVFRFKVTANKDELIEDGIFLEDGLKLEVKNQESALLRPLWITGPYSIYVDIVPYNFDERRKFSGENIQFVGDLKPDETFKGKLLFNENSRIGSSSEYSWTIDLIAQFTVITIATLPFVLIIGNDHDIIKHSRKDANIALIETLGFHYQKLSTKEIWNMPPPFLDKPAHLVIITHGIFSAVGGDMLFLKDTIERASGEISDEEESNVLIRGFDGNIGKSHKGIRYLGIRVAEFVIKTVDQLKSKYNLDKISFVGHSLGGPVQAMAIHYITVERPDIFDKSTGLKPMNFIAAASPFLGVIGDFPKYISFALDIGALGQTGRDLNLKRSFFLPSKGIVSTSESSQLLKAKPILEILPKSPALDVFQRFNRRTVYANVAFDGIVPLRTAALMYLDWKGLSDVQHVRNENVSEDQEQEVKNNDGTGIIPEDSLDKKSILQYLLPQTLIKREEYKPYSRTQTNNSSSDTTGSGSGSGSDNTNKESSPARFKPPKKPSTIRAAASTITAPLPGQEYFSDPASRTDKIIHDKFYSPNELPDVHYKHRKLIKKIVYPNYSIHAKEERIARLWQETMEWRKVLVELQPDSHNNIIVRRKFVNSFGWVAVDHLANEHFGINSKNAHTTIE